MERSGIRPAIDVIDGRHSARDAYRMLRQNTSKEYALVFLPSSVNECDRIFIGTISMFDIVKHRIQKGEGALQTPISQICTRCPVLKSSEGFTRLLAAFEGGYHQVLIDDDKAITSINQKDIIAYVRESS